MIVTGIDGRPEIFTDYTNHPFANRPPEIFSKSGTKSTASGRYQQLYKFWPHYKIQLKLADFYLHSQELLLDQLLREQGVYLDVLNGRFYTAMEKCCDIWVSLPGSPYGHPVHKMQHLVQVFQQNVGIVADKPAKV